MSDLISRQAALEAIKHAELGKEYEAVEALPTIEERKAGKWTNRWAQNGDQVKEVRECSECGAVYLRFYDTADGFDCVPPKYCPNCGADMRKDGD